MVGARGIGWGAGRCISGPNHGGMHRFAGDVASNAGILRCRRVHGVKSARHNAAGTSGTSAARLQACCPQTPRDAARDAPDLPWHTPKTPVGRRGVSLIYLRSTRVEANASPAPLHCHHPRRPWRSGASTCSLPCLLPSRPCRAIYRLGRLARTCSSPTGSGPEGSSPNETFTGRCQPPTSAYDGLMARSGFPHTTDLQGQHGSD